MFLTLLSRTFRVLELVFFVIVLAVSSEVVYRAAVFRTLTDYANIPASVLGSYFSPTDNSFRIADKPPLDQSGPSECPLLDVALTANVSATDSVPQNDHAVAELVLVNQFQLQPHTIREEPFSGADDRRADEHLKLVNKTSP